MGGDSRQLDRQDPPQRSQVLVRPAERQLNLTGQGKVAIGLSNCGVRLEVLRGDVQRLGAHTARRSAADFEVLAFAPTMLSDDTEAEADGFRPYLALYIGGMGAKEMNFHFDVFARMGYEEAAKRFRAHVRACASFRHRTDGNGLSEVGQLGVPGHVHQHVLRFDVPVEESLLMRERETGKGARMRREVGTTKDRRRDP